MAICLARNGGTALPAWTSAGPVQKQVIVGKGLQTSSFANRQAPALDRVGVNEVVAILRDVARDCGRCLVRQLNPEAVIEDTAVPVSVIGADVARA